MSAPLPLATPDMEITRIGVLAAASVVVATCSVAVTLAVGGAGGGTDEPAAAAGPRFATGTDPDAATPRYHNRAMQRRR